MMFLFVCGQKLDVVHTSENDVLDAPLLASLRATPTPYRLRGRVVEGFGRGSKLLGCPTANLDPDAFQTKLHGVPKGVYMGWAQVGEPNGNNPVYKTVLSLGTNPSFADSEHDTVESYILHEFPSDFYGQTISLLIVAYLRPMDKYEGLEKLIAAISRDVRVGDRALEQEPFKQFQKDEFFSK
jgi:FAD synthase